MTLLQFTRRIKPQAMKKIIWNLSFGFNNNNSNKLGKKWVKKSPLVE
jgi:hypothetical protein